LASHRSAAQLRVFRRKTLIGVLLNRRCWRSVLTIGFALAVSLPGNAKTPTRRLLGVFFSPQAAHTPASAISQSALDQPSTNQSTSAFNKYSGYRVRSISFTNAHRTD